MQLKRESLDAEDKELLTNPEIRRHVKTSRAESRAGKSRSAEELQKELDAIAVEELQYQFDAIVAKKGDEGGDDQALGL